MLWRQKKPGMPLPLKKAYDATGIAYGGYVKYDQNVAFSYHAVNEISVVVNSHNSYVVMSSSVDNENIISSEGRVYRRGTCKMTVTLRLKNPDKEYEINEISKVFNIEVY